MDLGDIIICDDKGSEKLIIERKTLSDLASSIKDGRYSEQSYRLNSLSMHNHNIIYLIEGDIHNYNNKYNKVKPETLQVTMFCLQYFKGFSLFKTRDKMETAEYILRITNKLMKARIERDKKRRDLYRNRHEKDLKGDPMRAGYLSYYILWGESTSLQANIRAFKKKFKYI